MTRKSDRFEQIANKFKITSPSGNYYKESYLRWELRKLLRAEYAWFRRMAQREDKRNDKMTNMSNDFKAGHHLACINILTRLTQRGR